MTEAEKLANEIAMTVEADVGDVFQFDLKDLDEANIPQLAEDAANGIKALVKYAMAEGNKSKRMAEVMGNLALPLQMFAEQCMQGHPLQNHFQRLPQFLASQVLDWEFELADDSAAAIAENPETTH